MNAITVVAPATKNPAYLFVKPAFFVIGTITLVALLSLI